MKLSLIIFLIILSINCFAQNKDTSYTEYHYPKEDSIKIMDFPLDEDDDIKEVIEESEIVYDTIPEEEEETLDFLL